MKNPFESAPHRRLREMAERDKARNRIEEDLRKIEDRISAMEHYLGQGEHRPGDGEILEKLREERSLKRAELKNYPL
ncbi:MAG: hypothetical protein ACKKL4_02805 [Patescibacteria group bacterium]